MCNVPEFSNMYFFSGLLDLWETCQSSPLLIIAQVDPLWTQMKDVLFGNRPPGDDTIIITSRKGYGVSKTRQFACSG